MPGGRRQHPVGPRSSNIWSPPICAPQSSPRSAELAAVPGPGPRPARPVTHAVGTFYHNRPGPDAEQSGAVRVSLRRGRCHPAGCTSTASDGADWSRDRQTRQLPGPGSNHGTARHGGEHGSSSTSQGAAGDHMADGTDGRVGTTRLRNVIMTTRTQPGRVRATHRTSRKLFKRIITRQIEIYIT